MRALVVALAGTAMLVTAAHAQEPVRLYAAGSLRAVMNEIGAAYAKSGGGPLQAEYGASGLLRDRLAKGERADVFASANIEHPESLQKTGRAGAVKPFARNVLCALVAPGFTVTSDTLLDRMLDPSVKLGTSTPKADPSGDYAFELFGKAEAIKRGAQRALEGKALKLTGGPDSPPPPKDRSVYGMLVVERKADIFLTYCTNAKQAHDENSTLQVVAVPGPLAVGALYGLTVMADASPAGAPFAAFVLSDDGRGILERHGFGAL